MQIFVIITLILIATLVCLRQLRIIMKYRSFLDNNEKATFKNYPKKDLPIYYDTYTAKRINLKKKFHLSLSAEDKLFENLMKNPEKTAPQLHRAVKKAPQNRRLLLTDSAIGFLLNDYPRATHIINNIEIPLFSSRSLKAQYLLLKAQTELYETDMQSAAVHISKALNLYKKLDYFFEEAACYQTLAQIYRITGAFDVAFTMFKEAQKIYTMLGINAKIAETIAYLGLLETSRNNENTAVEYLLEAHDICQKNNSSLTAANITNWLGLIYFLKNDTTKAASYFRQTIKNTKNPTTLCFAYEMLARTNLKQKNTNIALKYTDKALHYAPKKTSAAHFENLYLRAEILYECQKYDESRSILTLLIKENKQPTGIFYPANAYTLLGTIELKQGNLNIAETLFKQALDLEHSQNRLKGAAIDYNNLYELARHRGDTKQAEQYLKQAISYAEEIDDKDLLDCLTQKKTVHKEDDLTT